MAKKAPQWLQDLGQAGPFGGVGNKLETTAGPAGDGQWPSGGVDPENTQPEYTPTSPAEVERRRQAAVDIGDPSRAPSKSPRPVQNDGPPAAVRGGR